MRGEVCVITYCIGIQFSQRNKAKKKSGREVGQDLKKVRLSNRVFKKIKGVRTGGHGKTSS